MIFVKACLKIREVNNCHKRFYWNIFFLILKCATNMLHKIEVLSFINIQMVWQNHWAFFWRYDWSSHNLFISEVTFISCNYEASKFYALAIFVYNFLLTFKQCMKKLFSCIAMYVSNWSFVMMLCIIFRFQCIINSNVYYLSSDTFWLSEARLYDALG